jgi:molecular chaperone HtpG
MSEAKETHRFQADVTELLRLVIHSLYTNKEIFLRELLSNAFDALEKLRFRAVTEPELLGSEKALEVRIIPDPDAGTLTIEDTGIGMTREELAQNLGTIAHSGSRAFLEKMRGEKGADLTLIGQFGVGFYSAYLVADRVEVVSLAAGKREAHRWSSDAKESFSIEPARRAERGTQVVLHLRQDQKEYLDAWRIRELVRTFSDFVAFPVKLQTREGFETINRASALWQRSPGEVTPTQYEELYKHLTHDVDPPLAYTHFKIEGTQLFSGILYIPKKPPFELYTRTKRGLRLYVKRVFIMEDCEALLPQWLRFVRGVVDSDDLPLNVSRELLQDSSLARTIKKQLTKKSLERLEQMASETPADYATFWSAFGAVLKEGVAIDAEHRERIAALCRFRSTAEESTSLDAYVSRMKEDQKGIYYAIGRAKALADAPHLEALRARGHEVLLMADAVDEWAIDALGKYKDKPFLSAMREDLALEPAPAEKVERTKTLLARMKSVLGERVRDVAVTTRLASSPCCLVLPKGAPHAPMVQALRAAGHDVPAQRRILEVNPDSPLVQKVAALVDAGDPAADAWIETLHDLAIVSEGEGVEDPARFAKRLAELLGSAR